jgi:large subunit ribosomal protein L5
MAEQKEHKAEAGDKPEKAKKGGGDKAAKGGDKGAAKKDKKAKGGDLPNKPRPPPRLAVRYKNEIIPALHKELGLKSVSEVPKIEKIVVNMGLGEAISNNKILEFALDEINSITGQKAVVTKAKKSIANFKLREGMPIGAMVTLRRDRMWEFLDRLVSLALPRLRDFKGVSDKAFDGRGNYTLGIKEQIIFPEIEYDKVDKVRGMNICICTTAKNDVHGKALLTALGLPFRRREAANG